MDWRDYEKVTKDIYEAIGKDAGVNIECYGNNCKVEGKSGAKHQIDVLASHSDGIHTYKTAIECKWHDKKISKDPVMKLLSVIEDSNIDKGVLVSKKGFTPDAISFAKSKNIGLAWLRKVEKNDYGTDLPIFEVLNSKVTSPEILNFIINSEEGAKRSDEIIKRSAMVLVNSEGKESPIQVLINNFFRKLREENAFKPITVDYRFQDCFIKNKETNVSTSIQGIVITGVLKEREIDLGFKPVDKTWLIMKSLFEDKIITVSENGNVNESKFRFNH